MRFVLLTALAGFAAAQQPKPVDDATLKRAQAASKEWLTYGRDYAETHYSPLRQINDSNVSRLGLAWSWDTEASAGGMEATPLISNGVMYGTLSWSVVFAVDARTGKFKWKWDPEIPRNASGPRFCCGPVNRGVALYRGKVYSGTLDGKLVALDAETGKVAWQAQTTDPNEDYSITGAPRIVKGNVIIGNGGAEYAARGFVSAYDAETGKLAWRFYTVPGDPSKPFEHAELAAAAKTWKGEWWKMGGGGTVWDGMAYDPDADLLYIGTGNGGPWDQHVRSPGGGDNLYLSSILALRPDNGKMVWYYQTTPGDTWDYTAVQPLLLADLTMNGRQRKVIMQAPKNGFFYVLDRITGELLSADPYAKQINWAKGIDLKTGRPIENPEARFPDGPALVSPGPGGAHNWHPMSFNPATGLVYIPGQESSFTYVRDPKFTFEKNRRAMPWNTGVDFSAAFRPPATTAGPGAAPPPPPPGGFLVAMDPVAHKERWRITLRTGFNGGTMTTAGNLVFQGTTDGHFFAYSADKGEKLWEVQIAPGLATPVTYQLDGKQYVAILGGRGNTQAPSKLFAFELDGKP